MSDPAVVRVTAAADRERALAIRHEVFVEEQAVPLDLEQDGRDDEADHFLGRVDGVAVAAARLVAADGDPTVGVAQRVAVLADRRGSGIGRVVMQALEDRARARGMRTVELHAQVPVRGFYERLGYTAYGDEYDEAGIPHVSMRKPLD